jgi:hypothetical protein
MRSLQTMMKKKARILQQYRLRRSPFWQGSLAHSGPLRQKEVVVNHTYSSLAAIASLLTGGHIDTVRANLRASSTPTFHDSMTSASLGYDSNSAQQMQRPLAHCPCAKYCAVNDATQEA